ncbi:hypothetical protein K2X05_05065 [bacterium]|nr:hypothetical protein [bacterium]
MIIQNKNSAWDPFPTQWIWALILSTEALLFLIATGLIGSSAYFLLGPLIVYNLAIYFFPYLYFFYSPPKTVNNRFAIEWKASLQGLFPKNCKVHFFMMPEGSAPLWIFAHGSTIWVHTSESFITRFSGPETAMIQTQIFHLWKNGHLANSTTWSALQKTLPLWFIRNPRGTELMFAASEQDVSNPAEWLQLCMKVFHWMSHRINESSSQAFSPSLLFPTLTNYNEKSYFSLYQYLQNELIEVLKQGDLSHESTKSGSFVFNPDPFHRLDGSNGPGVGPSPSDRQN